MQFILFFLHYFFLLFMGAFIIVGFFAITRGTEEVLPDNSKRRVGKIFKGWYFFWFQEHAKKKRIYYEGDELKKLLVQMGNSTEFKQVILHQNMNSIDVAGNITDTWRHELEMRFGVKAEEKPSRSVDKPTVFIVFLYKEYPNYVFPWWVRDALAGCITCHSSWLGSICFWLPLLLTDQEQVWGTVFGFTDHLALSLILTWIAYCFSLAFLTTGIWKKYMA